MTDRTTELTSPARTQWSIGAMLLAMTIVAAYIAILSNVRVGMASVFCSILVSAAAILFRRSPNLTPIRTAMIAIGVAIVHGGIFVGSVRAYSAFSHPLRTWSGWRTGGGWPTLIGYTLLGMALGLISGLFVATCFLAWRRITARPLQKEAA